METTDAACHEAMQWVTRLGAQGGTSILQALLASPPTEPNPAADQKYPHALYGYSLRLSNYKEQFEIE